MTLLEEYVNMLSDSEMIILVVDHTELRQTGMLGNRSLRQHATTLMNRIGVDTNIVMWMEHLANEVYRNLALRYISQMDDGK